jgi:hypothetical protein
VPRRALLSPGAALALALASPLAAFADDDAEFTPVAQLSTPYRKFQRNEFQKVLMTELKAQAKDLDSRALMRLLFNDAATGAHNGSVHFRRAKDATPVCGDMRAARQLAGAADGRTPAPRSEELSRPENAGLAATVKQLEAVRGRCAAVSCCVP